MTACQMYLIEARIREEERQKRKERHRWIGMYAGLFLMLEIVGFLWFKGVIG